ncbi:YibE/F family protein [Ferrimonas balearica]|uniref:YibE/F family protein n=1 Tax=Ferrimonas balearica TaxID=44012 RepID=UPI001C99684D|nr:YibE/F family protein [Ferrimonas balearica]MBY5991017.1 YibE/F family protein [Ferrimonas balearica]
MAKRLLFPSLIFLLATALFWWSPSWSESFRPAPLSGQQFVKAEVIEVLEQQVHPDYLAPDILTGVQKLKIRILEGEEQGQERVVDNSLSRLHNVYVEAGDHFILLIREGPRSTIYWPYNYDRAHAVYLMAGLFLLLVLVLGGMQGLNSIVSLYFTAALVLAVLIPGIFAGWHPVWLTVALMAVKILVGFALIAGVNRKSYASMLGTLAGVVMAGLAAQLFGEWAQLSGIYLDKGEDIINLKRDGQVQIRWLLFVAIMISALGAIMDVAISMASSYHELREANPAQSERQRILACINIGRDVMGTMTNTLMLAFAGSGLTLMMMVWGFQMPVEQFMNIPAIALAIIHALAGSIGLVLSIPFTLLACLLVYRKAPSPAAD